MMSELKIGGVPEHLNIPWWIARDAGAFDEAGVPMQWVNCPGGTGEMKARLLGGELDAALMLTEGAITHAVKTHGRLRIVGTVIETPLAWGVHVPAGAALQGPDDLRGARFGISREGSGSHLMSFVYAMQRGWTASDEPSFVLVSDLKGAREAFWQGLADGFLWEMFMTKPLVDAGEWRRVDVCRAPWPAFALVTRDDLLPTIADTLRTTLATVRPHALALAADRPRLIREVTARFDLATADAEAWADQITWSCTPTLSRSSWLAACDALTQVGILDHTPAPDEVLAAGVCELV